jgi:uncharacterized protein (TIGR02996 family)
MTTQLLLATLLPGESDLLANVIADMADHTHKRNYAAWLLQKGDPRGEFLQQVVDGWESGAESQPESDEYSLVWQRTSGITLLQTMREEKCDSLTSLFQVVRPALLVNPKLATDELRVGGSKFGGLPDLADSEPWPEFKGRLHTFVGQINLAEIAGTQAARALPKAGLLSFFVFDDPIETGQPAACGAKGAWKVIYTPSTSLLHRREPHQEFDEGNRIAPECSLEFEETLDLPYASMYALDQAYAANDLGCQRARQLGMDKSHSDAYEAFRAALMPDREERSHLLGWSHPQVVSDDPIAEGYRNLLTVASETNCGWCWADGHQLYYSISDEDLRQHQFEHVEIVDG